MTSQVNPPNVPLVYPNNGYITREWYRYFVGNRKDVVQAAAGSVVAGDGLSGGGDVAGGVTISVADNGITNTMLRKSAGVSVIGRYANSTGNVADIVATDDGSVLGRMGGVVDFYDTISLTRLTVGSYLAGVAEVTADHSVINTETVVFADATSGAITVTLPVLTEGRIVFVKKIDASANAVTVSGAENIDGSASLSLASQYDSTRLVAGSSQWWVV